MQVTLLPRVDLPGIPGEILNALRPWREPVTEAASRMHDGAGPRGYYMRWAAERELRALGHYHRPDSNPAHGLRAVVRQLLIDPDAPVRVNLGEAITAFKDASWQGLGRWQQFETTEPPMFRALMRACQWATQSVD